MPAVGDRSMPQMIPPQTTDANTVTIHNNAVSSTFGSDGPFENPLGEHADGTHDQPHRQHDDEQGDKSRQR